MNVAREISQMSEDECFHALATEAQPGSVRATGIAARLQQIQLMKLSKQTAELVSIAEAQRVLAEKLDRQTGTLIGLTRWLRALTVGLVILTATLCLFETLHFLEARKGALQS